MKKYLKWLLFCFARDYCFNCERVHKINTLNRVHKEGKARVFCDKCLVQRYKVIESSGKKEYSMSEKEISNWLYWVLDDYTEEVKKKSGKLNQSEEYGVDCIRLYIMMAQNQLKNSAKDYKIS